VTRVWIRPSSTAARSGRAISSPTASSSASALTRPVSPLFSSSSLADAVRVVPPGATVDLRLGEACPVRLAYEFDDGHGSVETLVSPRIRG